MKRLLSTFAVSSEPSHVTLNGQTFQNLEAFAPAAEWEELSHAETADAAAQEASMIYSYTQISQYLRCPRSYRYRYLDGWREKDTRAAMVFGRCFEKALGAYFEQRGLHCGAVQGMGCLSGYSLSNTGKGNPGIGCCTRESICSKSSYGKIAFGSRIPKENLQLKITRTLAGGNEFVSYIDAIGELDGKRCLIDWKTTTSRYSEEPEGLLVARSAADLLFLDQRHSRMWPLSCSCENSCPRSNT